MKNILKLSFFLLSLLIFAACSDDDDDSPSVNISFEEITSSSVKVVWDEVDGADEYDVEYTIAGENGDDWETTTETSYVLTGLQADTEYEITVAAYKEVSEVESDEFASATKVVKTLAETE